MTLIELNGGVYSGPSAHGQRSESAADIVNALTVDVEDYFQVGAFQARIARKNWDSYPSRVEANTELLLDLFDAAQVHATFFVLGWIAERHPRLVRAIAARGHEVASHGYDHTNVSRQSRVAFRADIRRTRRVLEDIGGRAVCGYRAANFSIGPQTAWTFSVLEEGYTYSSSLYPMRNGNNGAPLVRRAPFTLDQADALLEIPLTTVSLLGICLPCSDRGYFRLWPYPVSRWALRRVNRREERPAIFYVHPGEVDPQQPRVRGATLVSRLRHYINLTRVTDRLCRLLEEFRCDRVDRVFFVEQPELMAKWPCRQSG